MPLGQPDNPVTLKVIAFVLASAAACTSENNAAIAFGALLAALCQNVFFGQSVSNIFSIKVYLIKKILMKIIVEIKIERKRRKLKLPYKNIFTLRTKRNKKLSFTYPRIKQRKLKIFSRNLTVPVFYNKKIKIKSESEPMVQFI
jgi:hypothetical protein